MAHVIDFTSAPPEPARSQKARLDAELAQNADAVRAAITVLEEAHEQQLLDLLRGAIGAKNEIFSALAEAGSKPATVNAARNAIALAKALGAIDPVLVSKASSNLSSAIAVLEKENPPPSLWQLFKRARHPDVRRGISFLLKITAAIGRTVE